MAENGEKDLEPLCDSFFQDLEMVADLTPEGLERLREKTGLTSERIANAKAVEFKHSDKSFDNLNKSEYDEPR